MVLVLQMRVRVHVRMRPAGYNVRWVEVLLCSSGLMVMGRVRMVVRISVPVLLATVGRRGCRVLLRLLRLAMLLDLLDQRLLAGRLLLLPIHGQRVVVRDHTDAADVRHREPMIPVDDQVDDPASRLRYVDALWMLSDRMSR